MSEPITDAMPLDVYLAQGGKLTSPENVPPRYRGELMRMMAIFVDSELAGAAGFADTINAAPGIKQRIAASRIVLEKLDHAERVLAIMGNFGADISRYANHHPWTARVARETDLGAARHGQDMRLSVFHYPVEGWADAVAMNVLMGAATVIQLGELGGVSYQPLAEAFRFISARERRHMELGIEGLRQLAADAAGREAARASLAYWHPRVAASFGGEQSKGFETQRRFGLRHTPNAVLRSAWEAEVARMLGDLGLEA